jgi:CDP-diglyceride synthetase
MRDAGETAPRKRAFFLTYLAMIAVGSWATYEWLALAGEGILSKAGPLLAAFGLWMIWIDFIAINCE